MVYYLLTKDTKLPSGPNLTMLRIFSKIKILYIICCFFIASGCTAAHRMSPAANAQNYTKAQIKGYKDIRYWGDKPPEYLDEVIKEYKETIKKYPENHKKLDILALSGGADDGAYGAGFLKGWSDTGTRPEFNIVTGVSTGALIAPFAFLGKEYDDKIKHFYTELSSDDIVIFDLLDIITKGLSIVDTAPLKRLLEEEINEELIIKIAKEHKKGRKLLIGTTNLDAQRQMVWNIGKIAQSNTPEARKLIIDILLASASLPGVFPPVMIDVEINGNKHQELHVDGGVTYEIFVYPRAVNFLEIERDLNIKPVKNFWLIRNTKIDPDFLETNTHFTNIAQRAMSTLIKYQGRGDLAKLEHLAKRDGFNFHLTFVPQDFQKKSKELFDPEYMSALYERGYKEAISQNPWHSNLHNVFMKGISH